MDKVKEFYAKYKVYLTRQNLELLAVTVIVLSAILVFTSGIPGKGVLTLDQGKIKYDDLGSREDERSGDYDFSKWGQL